jgi:hypothetical protein
MKIDNNNYNEMNRIRRELLAVLDNQFETLPADWDVYDHAMVVMHIAVGEMLNCGATEDDVRDEVDIFLRATNDPKYKENGNSLN